MGAQSVIRAVASNWWVFLGIVVIVLFFNNAIATGVLLILAGIGIGIVIFIVKRRSRATLSKSLIGFDKVNERELARISKSYTEDAHAFLHDVSRNPDSSGVAILVKGEYVYFSNDVVKQFKEKYKEGKNTKELLAELDHFETREEVKQLIEKLKEFDELPAREKKASY